MMKIEVKGLTKRYGKHKAINNLNFIMDQPKIYGLLGRNGAGKTTFMDILAGFNVQSDGQLLINEETPFNNRHITKNICLIKENDNFPEEMKVKHIFKMCRILYENWDQGLVDELVQVYRLPIHKKLKTYSKGMASAVGIIVGLASNAPITLFDEPYIGLDAAGRKTFYDVLLAQYEENERMIVLSTHLIDEVSLLFEEVLILREGELIVHETADELRTRACRITGDVDQVNAFIEGKQVLEEKQIGHLKTVTLLGRRSEAEAAGFEPEGVAIQDLMIYLTEKEGA